MPPKLFLMLDWDSTLTTHDTLSILASIGYEQGQKSNIPRPWSEIVNAYLVDYRIQQSSFKPAREDRKSVASELEWLSSLSQIERQSFLRFQSQMLFSNISAKQMRIEAGKAVKDGRVQLRPDWSDLLTSGISTPRIVMTIISVNWSAAFIRGCLLEGAVTACVGQDNRLIDCVEEMPIHANEICSEPGHADAHEPKIVTGEDKLRVMQDICASHPGPRIAIYVGDSTSDLHCLLAADIGICIRDDVVITSTQQDLKETLQRIGVQEAPLKTFQGLLQANSSVQNSSSKTLWWTSNLAEISQVISNLKIN